MNKSLLPAAYKIAFLSFFLVSILYSTKSQAQATFVSARHETITQRDVDVNLNSAVSFSGAPSTVGWTVTINGVGVPITSIGTFGPNTVRIQFNASAIAGHLAGENFLKPGETLRVSYAGGGNLTAPGITPFGLQVSQNNFAFTCSEMSFLAQGTFPGAPAVDVCIPVVMNFTQYQFRVSLRWRNSTQYALGATGIQYNIAWGDGTFANSTPYQSDAIGVANATFLENTGFGGNPGIILTLRPTKTYPSTTTPAPTVCSWDFQIRPIWNSATLICSGITQTTIFNNWDVDNLNTGSLALPFNTPVGTETTDRICLGTNVNMRFTDQTLLNCRIGVDADKPNQAERYVRIVYGSQVAAAPGNIPDVRITLPAVLGGGTTQVTNNNATGTLIFPGGFTPVSVGVADFNGAINVPAPVTAATALQFMGRIVTTQTNNQAVGQRFYIRMDYWDVCNPYNPATPNSPAPVSISVYDEIITKPAALSTAGLSICYTSPNSTAFNFTATNPVAGRTAVNWYKDRASVGTATKMTNPNGTNSLTFPASAYGAQGGIGGAFTSNNTNGRYHSVWATQLTGTNACESDPIEIVIIQQPRIDISPDIPSTPSGAIEVCNGGGPEAYTTSAPNTKTIPITTSTNGAAINLPTENLWSVSGYAATVSLTPTTGNATAVTFSIAPEPNPSDAGQVRVRRQYVTSTNIAVVSPLPAPFTLPTYNISPQACQNANVNLNVTVFGISDGGAISGSPTICTGSSTGNMTLSGHRGAVLQWERKFNAGAFIAIGGTAGLTTFSEIPPNGAGTYKYRALVQNQGVTGPCAAVTTIVANQNTVTVNPVPAKPTIGASGPTTFCLGSNVTLTSSNVGGLAASYRWYKDGVFTGTTTSTIVLSTVAQSGDYTVEVIGAAPSSCISPLSDPVTVLVNPRPTATVAGGGSVCSGTPAADIVWTMTGTAPFDFTITLAPGAPIVVVGHNSTTYTIPAPNPGVNTTYTMTSLTDANTCSGTSLGGAASVTVQATPPPTVDSFTAQAPVCDDGAGTNPPDAILDLQPNSVQNYAITYRLRRVSTNTFLAGSINFTGNSSATGVINLAPSYAQFGAAPNDPAGYEVVITAIQNTVTLCAGAVPFGGPILIINPRPPTPTGAVPGVICSTSATGAPISVAAPAVGFTIVWSSTAAPVFTAAAGTTGGTRGNTFTPTSNATANYHAFTRDDVAPTNCLSSGSLPVQHTQDVQPAAAAAGANQPTLCAGTATLAANPATNGGNGTWSVLGQLAYVQNFENAIFPVGTTSSSAGNGWSINISDANAFPQQGGSGYFEVKAGKRFEANNTNGNLGGGVTGEVVWTSSVIDISSIPSVDAFVDLIDVTNNLDADDYIIVNYILNGGAETLFTTAGSQINDFAPVTASVTGLSGSTLQIVIRVNNTAGSETIAFDNVIVKATGSTVTFTDPNSPASTVSNLPQNPPGGAAIPYTARWTVSSALGVCPSTTSDVILTVNPLPTSVDPAPQLCEDVSGGGATANVDLTAYNTAVSNAPTITWYSDAARTIVVAAPVTVNNTTNKIFYFRAQSAIPCINVGQITFTVNTLPGAVDRAFEFCENSVGAGIAGNVVGNMIDLTSFEFGAGGVASGGTAVTRDVEWYEDAALTTLIPAGAGVGQEQNYTITTTKTIFAKVIDITSSVTPKCFDVADVTLTLKLRPVNNPITGSATVCSGQTIVLYQVDPSLNPASNYTWNVSGTADFQVFGGGGTNSANFFILLKFPGPTLGNVNIDVFETVNGCDGNTSNFVVTVAGAPGALTFNSPQTNVCKNQTGVVFSLNAPNPSSLYTWTAPGASFQGPSSGVGLSSVTLDFTTVNTTLSVTETSSSGCAGSPASVVINLSDRPVMSSSNATSVCSGNAPTLNFTANLGGPPTTFVTFGWQVINITGTVSGTTVGNIGTGNLSEVLTNTSGVIGTVTYRVTPTETAVPNPPNCTGTPQDVVVTVNPQPVLVSPQTKTICSGEAVNYEILLNPSTLPAGTTFSWPLPIMSAGAAQGTTGTNVPGGGAGSIHITDVLTNTTTSPITATYTITPTVGGTCPGTPQTVVITINPQPTVSTTLNNTVCSDVATALNLSTAGGSVAAANYNVSLRTISAGLTAAGGNAFVPATGVAANYLANDAFTNLTANPLDVTYTVVGVSALGCIGSPQVITITINPEPVVANGLNATICSDLAIGLTLNTNGTSVAAATYNITSQTIAAGLVAAGTNVAPANGVGSGYLSGDVYTNTGLTPLNVSYTVVPVSAAGCLGDARIITIAIDPEPVISNTLNKTVCSQEAIALTFSTRVSSVAAASYDVTAINVAAGLTAGGSNVAPQTNVLANYVATDTYTNTGSSALDVAYTVVPRSAAGCYGDPLVITVTINPEPTVSASLNASVCSDLATGLTLNTAAGSVAAASYSITARTIAGGLTPAAGNAFIPVAGAAAGYLANDRFTNLSAGPLDVTYTVQGFSAAGCFGAPRFITITINPEPVVSNSLDASVCSDLPIGLSLNTNGTSVAAATYNITSRTVAAGLVIGANATIPSSGEAANYLSADTYTNTGTVALNVTYTVVPVSASGCLGDPKVITIGINPEPVISSGLNKSACSRAAIALTLTTNASSVAAASYNVTSITVDPGLTAGGSNVATGNGVAANYLANDTYSNTGGSALPVTYTVVPRSAAGCLGDPVVITVTINPEPVLSATLDNTICSDVATGLVLNTNGASIGAASYNITTRSIAVGLTPNGGNVGVPATGVAANFLSNDIFTNTGSSALPVTYTVVPVSSAGCLGAPVVVTITINPEPIVSNSLDATICSGDAIGLALNTNGTSVSAATYNISGRTIAAGLVASGGNVVVPTAGVAANYLSNDIFTNTGVAPLLVTYTVVPISAAGCLGDARVITITINPEPVVSTTLDATVCSDASIGLTFNTNGTSVPAANYNVTSVLPAAGLIPNAANAVISASGVAANYVNADKYTNPTATPLTVVYTVVAVSSVNCLSQPRLITITINPEPVVANTLDATVCSDLTIGLTLATNGTSVAAASYNVTARTVAAGLTGAGTNVAVPATGVAPNYLSGEIFTNTGAVSRTVTYTVVPVSASGCLGDPKNIIITISPEPVVANGLNTTVCSDLSVGITLNTNGTSVAAANYNITARTIAVGLTPNGANAIVPATGVVPAYLSTDKFTNLGATALTVTYTVVPVSAAGCLGDARVITATIDPEPVVSTSLNATICSDVATALLLNTNGLSVAATNYNVTARSIDPALTPGGTNAIVPGTAVANNYLSNDSFTNTGALPLNVTYTVEPVSAIGCVGDPVIVTITVNPEPVLSGTLNLTQCSDVPTGLVLNTNGSSVAAQNYNVTAVNLQAGLTAAGTNAAFPATGVNANYLGNDVFTNTGSIPLTVTYTIRPVSAAGCLGDPASVVVTINPEPVVSNSLNTSVCSDINIGLTLNTNGTSVSAADYDIVSRTIPGGLTAGAGNAVLANNVPANYLVNDVYTNTGNLPLDVTYTVVPRSAALCLGDAKIITITINPEPVVSTGLDATICSDAAIGLTLNTNGTSVAAATYNITAQTVDPGLTPAGTNVALANGVAANYLANNRYTNTGAVPLLVTYTVVPRSAGGCLGNPQVITITVNPEPVLENGLDVNVCSDLPNGLVLSTLGTSVSANDYNITGVIIPAGLTAAGTNAAIPATGVAFTYLASDSYTNITASALIVTYTIVPRSAALCLGDPKNVTVTIQPEPVIATNLDASKCSDIATGLTLNTNGTSVAAANYNVTLINVPGGLIAAGSNAVAANGVAANYLALDVFTNTTAAPLDVQYTVVPVSAVGCQGNPRVITITINPEPVIATTLDATVCSDLNTGLTLNTNGVSVAASLYDITSRTVAAGLTPAVTNAAVPVNGVAANYLASDRFTNTGSTSLTVVYVVRGISAATCVGDTQAITITINPEPVLASGLNRSVCSDIAGGIIFNTNGTSVAAANYNVTLVSIPAGLTPVSTAAIPATGVAANYLATDVYTNTGNVPLEVLYTVVPVSAAGCLGDPLIIKQIVNPEPVLAVLDKTVCSDLPIGITMAANGVSVAASTYDVTNIVVAGGLTAAGTNAAIPGTGVASNYIFNDQFTNPGNTQLTVQYTVVPISAASCAGDPVVIVITVDPEPVVSPTLDRTVCSDTPGGIVLNTNGTSTAAANYNITNIAVIGGLIAKAGNATIANGVGVNYLAADQFTNTTNGALTVTYTVVPVSAIGCLGNPLDIILTVEPEPVVDPALATKSICSREITNITLNTNGVSVAAANYNISLISQDAGLTGVPTVGVGLADNAILNDNYINVTSTPLKVVYQIVPVSAVGCLGDPFNITVTVNAEPVVNPLLANTVCSNEISGIILSTNGTSVAAASYRFVNVVVPGTITADGANAAVGLTGGINLIRNDKYINTTNAAAVVTYEIRGISSLLCEGVSEFINLTINPEPIMGPGTANLCSDVPSGIIVGPIAGSATITQYELKNIVKAPALVAGGSNAGLGTYLANLGGGQSDFLSNDTFTNTTNGPLVVTYTVVPIASGCRGQDQTVVFTVNPAPAVDDNLNKTVCSDGTAGIVFATETSPPSTAAASYNITAITVQAGLIRTAGNAAFPRNGVTANEIQADQFQNPTNDPLTVTYSVQAVSGSACLGPVRNIILTVEPQVIAAPVNNAPSICSNDQTDIDLISPTNPTSGVITFNYTAVSSVGGLISGFVPSLNSLPENYKITDALVNNSDNPATVTYSVTANANGARNGAGCSSIAPVATVVVTVDPKPKLVATPTIQTRCEGVATNVTLNSATVPGAGNVRFELLSAVATGGVTGMSAVGTLFNPGSTLAEVLDNPTITAQTVTYTLQPKVIGGLGCIGDNVVVTITVNPTPTIVASAQPDICSGDFINITLTPDVANTIAVWTVSAPATVAGASNGAGNLIFQTLFNNGNVPETVNYTVTPRVNGCDGTPIVIGVVVNPKPKFVGLPTTVTVCHGNSLNVPLTSTVTGTTFDWVVDDPSGLGVPTTGSGNVINQPLTNTTGSQASLTYSITPTGPGSCPGDQKIMIVTVSPQINTQFVNASSSICKGSSEFLIIQLDGQAPFQMVYNDGTSDITVNNAGNFKVIQVTPTVTTTYTLVSVKDALNCTFTPAGQSVTVTVGETDANFSIVGPASSCGPYDATFQFNQVAGTEYTWQWFDGSPDEVFLAATSIPNNTITHTFSNPNPNAPITYKVTLRTQLPAPFPGCFKTQTHNVTVFPSIITNAFPDRSDICSGENIQFFNQSFGATSHRWFYRVQGTATEIDIRLTPTVNYNFVNTSTTNPIIYEVVYQANNGNCPANDVVIPITVYRGITAGFDEGTIPPFIGGNSTVTFTNTSVPVDAAQFRYEWTFGLNSTPSTGLGAGPFSVNYSTPGVRDVSLKVINIAAEAASLGCESSFTKTINIPLLPLVAAFKADPQRACFPSDFTVTENTSTGDIMEWRVVDSNGRVAATSNAALPVFRITNPGSYSIFLTTSNSLTGQVANTQQDGFEVFDNPVASFDLRPNVVFVPDTELTTFNFSTGTTDYDWDFGDGGTSFDVEPKYVYKVEGVYDVRLIARNDHGQGLVCTDTLIRKVTAKQGGVSKVPNAFTPNPNGPSGGSTGPGGSGTFNDVFLPIVKGAEEFNMQIFDRWGNLIFESNSANVGWDGYDKNGRLLPAGVFVYKLTIRLSDGQRSTQIGDVTMIR
jgi:gliding motility-associated-like protein